MVGSDLIYRDRVGETYSVRFNPAHRWGLCRWLAPLRIAESLRLIRYLTRHLTLMMKSYLLEGNKSLTDNISLIKPTDKAQAYVNGLFCDRALIFIIHGTPLLLQHTLLWVIG